MRCASGVACVLFVISAVHVMATTVLAAGDGDKGRDVAEEFCQGCHVVGTENRLGGIDSTPSFFLMSDKLDNYRQRLRSLKRRPPHISIKRLEAISDDDIEQLLVYISKLERP